MERSINDIRKPEQLTAEASRWMAANPVKAIAVLHGDMDEAIRLVNGLAAYDANVAQAMKGGK